jgi:hypothetical protein
MADELCADSKRSPSDTVPMIYLVLAMMFPHIYIYIYIIIYIQNYIYTYNIPIPMNIPTSSTAQGGGGSFKNRKPIGDVGCCESGMAERSH